MARFDQAFVWKDLCSDFWQCIIVRREMDGARATLRPTDRVRRTARSGMRDFLPFSMLRRKSR